MEVWFILVWLPEGFLGILPIKSSMFECRRYVNSPAKHTYETYQSLVSTWDILYICGFLEYNCSDSPCFFNAYCFNQVGFPKPDVTFCRWSSRHFRFKSWSKSDALSHGFSAERRSIRITSSNGSHKFPIYPLVKTNMLLWKITMFNG